MEYKNLEQQIHQLSQIIAKFNRTFVPKVADDSHTNLAFDPLGHRIYGRWVECENQKIILALNLESFQYEIINDARIVIKYFPIQGKTVEKLEEVIAGYLPQLGIDSQGFTDQLHFEIPIYDFATIELEKWDNQVLKQWEQNRALANDACALLLTHLQVDGEIRIWPHHFDTGIYVEPNTRRGIGFGLSIADSMVNESYFYCAGYALNGDELDYASFSKLQYGKWVINDTWKGAVLTLSTINKQPNSIKSFLTEVSACLL